MPPVFRFGMMTDNHLGSALSGMEERTRSVFRLFRREGTDLIVDGGDIADSFQPEQLKTFRRLYEETWPDPEKRPPLFTIAAGHDRNDHPDPDHAYPEILSLLGAEEVNPSLRFRGYAFLGLSQFQDPAILKKMLAQAEKEDPEKPVFVLTHAPAEGTVYRSEGPLCDAGYRAVLEGHSRVIHLSGHVHTPVFFDRQIWQGSFTAVNAGSLTYWKDDPYGRESRVHRSCDALIFDVCPDKIRIFRYDGLTGKECAPCWEFPLPMIPETAPFRPEERRKNCPVPEFPAGEEIFFRMENESFVTGLIDLPAPVRKNTVHRFRITLREEDREIAVLDYFPVSALPGSPENRMVFPFPFGMLKGETAYSGTVVPMNVFDRKGAERTFSFRTGRSAVREIPLSGLLLETGGKRIPLEDPACFSTSAEHPSCRLILPEETKRRMGTRWGLSFDFAAVHPGRPAILMAAGSRPFWGRHTFPCGTEPFHRHCFDFSEVFFPAENRCFPEDEFSIFLGEGEPGEYRIRSIRLCEMISE